MWSLGNMSYHPGEEYMRTFLASLHASGLLPRFDSQNIGNLVWGMARLGEHPGAQFIRVLRERRDDILFDNGRKGVENVQAMTNVLWALCVFDELDPALAAGVYARLDLAAATINIMAKAQLFQSHLYLEAALPGRAPDMAPPLLRACREAWLGMKDMVTVSMFQWSVLASVRFAGFAVQPEYREGFFCVDIATFLPGDPPVKVAIEVDGIEHYSCNRACIGGVEQYRPSGRTVLRNRLLRAHGWAVCDVPWFEWSALKSQRDKQAYLKARIALELRKQQQQQQQGGATAA